MTQEQSEPEVEGWMYPYLAGALDFTTGLHARVQKSKSHSLGYTIVPTVTFVHQNKTPLGMVDMICEQHGISTSMNQRDSGTYRLQVTGSDNIKTLLENIEPFIIGSAEQVNIMVNNIIPALELGEHHDKDGFIDVMDSIDNLRQYSSTRGTSKYTKEFFEDEWNR